MHPFAQSLLTHLRSRGFDLSAAFPVQSYNNAVPQPLRLPTYSYPASSSTLGILVANSKALWPCFCQFIRAQPAFIHASRNPFDAFVTLQVDECISLARIEAQVPKNIQHDVSHYWELTPGRMVAIQRMCQVAGVAYLDEGCHLNVHAKFGPWLALRSAIIIDLPGPDPYSIPKLTNPIPSKLHPHLHHALAQLLPPNASSHTRPAPSANPQDLSPSRDGLTPEMLAALEVFNEIVAQAGEDNKWKAWVALRRVAASWLSEEQQRSVEYDPLAIEYHYTKESHVLQSIVDKPTTQTAS